jgi:outer membrane protein assembly factor BamB
MRLNIKSMKFALTLCFLTLYFNVSAAAGSWPQFRGPNCSGVAEKENPSVAFGPGSNLHWKVQLPSGLSSPCIWKDRIFLTGFENDKLFTICINGKDGKELWRREAPPGKLPEVHEVSSPAVATPASDGQRVYVYYSSFGLVAYDFSGKEQWRAAVPTGIVVNGSGTSPALAGDTLILNCDQDEGKSLIMAVDARTGKKRWETPRPDFIASYTTPIVWKRGREEDAVVCGSLRVVGYNLRDGSERWTARVLTSVSVAATPVVGDGRLYVMSQGVPANSMGTFAQFAEKNDKDGDGKVSRAEAPPMFLRGGIFTVMDFDKDGHVGQKDWEALNTLFAKGDSGLFAIRSPGTGDITQTHVAWKQKKGVAAIASPLFYRGQVYAVQDGGRVSSWNAETGVPLYEQERLDADGQYFASPIAANGHIYFCSSRGKVSVAEAGDSLKVKARNDLEESIMATPAIAEDKLYIRTAKHLWAFGK